MGSLKDLVKKGKSQGYITHREFTEHMPSGIVEDEQIADIIKMLKDMGVEIRKEKAEVIQLNPKHESE